MSFNVYFWQFFALVLIAAHTANNGDLRHDQSFENDGYESEWTCRQKKKASSQNFVSRTEIQNFKVWIKQWWVFWKPKARGKEVLI